MDAERIKIIETSLNVFGYSKIQDLYSMILFFERAGITIEEFKEWIEYRQKTIMKEEQEHRANLKKAGFACPDCGQLMKAFPVNENDYDMVGGDYKSQVICPDVINCGHVEYSEKSLEEWGKEFDGFMKTQKPVKKI